MHKYSLKLLETKVLIKNLATKNQMWQRDCSEIKETEAGDLEADAFDQKQLKHGHNLQNHIERVGQAEIHSQSNCLDNNQDFNVNLGKETHGRMDKDWRITMDPAAKAGVKYVLPFMQKIPILNPKSESNTKDHKMGWFGFIDNEGS